MIFPECQYNTKKLLGSTGVLKRKLQDSGDLVVVLFANSDQ